MEELLEINFVYANEPSKVRTFLEKVPRNIECINYIDIYDKLTKNDYYDYKPSDEVVSTYLIRQIHHVIEKNLRTVYYVLGCIEKERVLNIQNYIQSLTDKTITFNIYYSSDITLNGTSKLFNELREFE
jgi:hypothetical protein